MWIFLLALLKPYMQEGLHGILYQKRVHIIKLTMLSVLNIEDQTVLVNRQPRITGNWYLFYTVTKHFLELIATPRVSEYKLREAVVLKCKIGYIYNFEYIAFSPLSTSLTRDI